MNKEPAITGSPARPASPAEALARIKDAVGPKGWTDAPDALEPWLVDSRGTYRGACALMVMPASTEEVASVVAICSEYGIPIVPQGGNTGRCGGSTPDADGRSILLNLVRMNRIRDVDATDFTMTVEAGCILQTIQTAAEEVDRLFPLSLGAEGSCQIGGNLATNAGGINVLRYGNARELVLGLEVVLPSGEVWQGLRRLRKDNTGYDLKDLFIGSEGTLGIITAAVLRLFPRPKDVATALVALDSTKQAITLLGQAREASGDALTSFEIMARITLETAERHIERATVPLSVPYEWAVLIEFGDTRPEGGATARMESFLEAALEDGLVTDAVIAQSEQQRKDLWFLREAILDGQAFEGEAIKGDISVAVSRIPEFVQRAAVMLEQAMPGIRPFPFGHVGDGNLHYNLSQPVGMDPDAFKAEKPRITKLLNDLVHEMEGSISAEHGIGQLKRDLLPRYKDALDLKLMRQIKATLDPKGLMNPGKLL